MTVHKRKGILLVGGSGSRLFPLTKFINKHLLPVFNKPVVLYPLKILLEMNIQEILIICNKKDLKNFKTLLGNGKKFGIKLSYTIQKKPNGIAYAYLIAKKFLKNSASVLILGDNILYGKHIKKKFDNANKNEKSTIFSYEIDNPKNYGVLEKKNNDFKIIEKPKRTKSKKAIIGIYFLDKNATKYAKKLKISKRKEYEITDLNNIYLEKKIMNIQHLTKKDKWFDVGTFEGLLKASNFMKKIKLKTYDHLIAKLKSN